MTQHHAAGTRRRSTSLRASFTAAPNGKNGTARTTSLVTGGAGFIGGHLVEHLLAQGHHVIAIDNLSTGNPATVERIDHPEFQFAHGSILDEPLVDELVSQVDQVFHLAAAVGVQLVIAESFESLRTNVRGTEIILESARRHSARSLIASTSEVYGKNAACPLSETTDRILGSPAVRRWSYAQAKALDETMAYLYHTDLNSPTVVARLFNVAGPRQTGRYGMVIPRFVGQALRGEPLTVFGGGQQTRSFCHVLDVVAALAALIDSPAAYGQVFNIGRPQEVSIRYLAERVITLTDSLSTIQDIPYDEAYGPGFEDTERRVPDVTRAREVIGFDPQLTLDDIIMNVVAEQREHMLALEPVSIEAVPATDRVEAEYVG